MRVHWNLWVMAALGLLSIVAFLQLASLLRDLTRCDCEPKETLKDSVPVRPTSIESILRHDKAVDKEGREYIIVDL